MPKLSPAQLAALEKGRGSGSGGRPRKPESEKRRTVSMSLSPALIAALEFELDSRHTYDDQLSMSQLVEDLLREHPALSGWMK